MLLVPLHYGVIAVLLHQKILSLYIDELIM